MHKIKMILSCLLFCTTAVQAQSNLFIFSEDGDNFTLYANGVRKNSKPDVSAKALNLTGDGVRVRIVFQSPTIAELSKYILLEKGKDQTFSISKNKKGVYVLKPATAGTDDVAVAENQKFIVSSSPTEHSATSQRRTSSPPPDSTCALTANAYHGALNAIRAERRAKKKSSIARMAITGKCISVEQVNGMAVLLDEEPERLAFIKFAYQFTNDRVNYYTLRAVLTQPDNINKLSQFLQSQN